MHSYPSVRKVPGSPGRHAAGRSQEPAGSHRRGRGEKRAVSAGRLAGRAARPVPLGRRTTNRALRILAISTLGAIALMLIVFQFQFRVRKRTLPRTCTACSPRSWPRRGAHHLVRARRSGRVRARDHARLQLRSADRAALRPRHAPDDPAQAAHRPGRKGPDRRFRRARWRQPLRIGVIAIVSGYPGPRGRLPGRPLVFGSAVSIVASPSAWSCSRHGHLQAKHGTRRRLLPRHRRARSMNVAAGRRWRWPRRPPC